MSLAEPKAQIEEIVLEVFEDLDQAKGYVFKRSTDECEFTESVSPDEVVGLAQKIRLHCPDGKLLRLIIFGDKDLLTTLQKIAAPGCDLDLIFESTRLVVEDRKTKVTPIFLHTFIIPKFISAGFRFVKAEVGARLSSVHVNFRAI